MTARATGRAQPIRLADCGEAAAFGTIRALLWRVAMSSIRSAVPKRDGFSSNRHPALAYCWSMMFSENRYPPRIASGAGFFGIMLLGAALAAAIMPAGAEDWPTPPVTMVVSFPAGSGSDVLARILGARLSEILGQQVVIENVGGGGGMTGAYRVARAAPDGYQFVLGGTDTFAQS